MSLQPVCYHSGFLMLDRLVNGKIHAIAREMWRLQERGKVSLAQKRLGPGRYEYWAIPKAA